MGQKVHPYRFRLGITKTWRSRWFAKQDYCRLLEEDLGLRAMLKKRLRSAGISSVEIDRPGNKLAFGLKNLLQNPHVGLLFLLPGTEETLRVNGRAEIHASPVLLEQLAARGKPAILALRVEVEECFFHCAKASYQAMSCSFP